MVSGQVHYEITKQNEFDGPAHQLACFLSNNAWVSIVKIVQVYKVGVIGEDVHFMAGYQIIQTVHVLYYCKTSIFGYGLIDG